MLKLWPALKFAFWTWFWTLVLCLLFYFVTEFSNRGSTGPEIVWDKPGYYWAYLKGFWFLPLPIFPAALLGFLVSPRWGKAVTLLLTPLLLLGWIWSPYRMPPDAVFSLMLLILPAAFLASVPDLIRQHLNRSRRSRVA